MVFKTSLLGAAFLTIAYAGTSPASAATPLVQTPMAGVAEKPLVATVHYRTCRRVYGLCRYRWGYGWRFRRCMRARGC